MRLSDTTIRKLQKALRINMLMGLAITVIATYLIITNTYPNIQARQSQETVLSIIALSGLFYTFVSWLACVFRKQFFQDDIAQRINQ